MLRNQSLKLSGWRVCRYTILLTLPMLKLLWSGINCI